MGISISDLLLGEGAKNSKQLKLEKQAEKCKGMDRGTAFSKMWASRDKDVSADDIDSALDAVFGKSIKEADEPQEPQEIEKQEQKPKDIETDEPEEDEDEGDEEIEDKPSVKDEIIEALEDLNEDELEALMDVIYLFILGNEDREKEEGEEEAKEGGEVTEASIKHLTGLERSQGKMLRRTPKWKKKARTRYLKNKKCPAGTTWSSKERTCTKIDIDMSRLQKIIAKMKIKG
jgi:hypothetical protein